MDRPFRGSRIVALTLAFTLGITGIVGQPASAAAPWPTPPLTSTQRLDGETLFRALAFAQGPAAALFPEFSGFPALSPQQLAATDRIAGRLRQIDPQFFASFATIQDGSRPNIRGQLERAGTLLQEAIKQEFGLPTSGGPVPACVVVFVALVVVLDVAAVVTVVIDVTAVEVVNLAVTGNVVVNTNLMFAPVASGGVQLSPLAHDQWIDKIARTLARV